MGMNNKTNISRRDFLRRLGLGSAVSAAALAGCKPGEKSSVGQATLAQGPIPTDQMTYRINPKTHEKVSILGYGCMRWPTIPTGADGQDEIDQEMVNQLIDTALEHGVNYFDTSPAYCKGRSEKATGIALSRHPRDSYFIATKLSNFAPSTWGRKESLEMYHNSFKLLQVDKIDYLLLHGIGMGAGEYDGMEALKKRYFDNGVLDYLAEERKAGRIGNLGFSYHGDIEAFDYLLSLNDKYNWDFVQIQLNYLDWKHAKEINKRNTNAEYLYNELASRNIPAVIMEPLLGGRLAKVHDHVAERLLQREPERSVASWAFRYAGSHPDVLTVLSGMTYMEHLEDNLRSFCPLKPLNEEEMNFLYDTADLMMQYPTIPCNDCKYCMPCPYGIDIPGVFLHYNKCVNEGNVPKNGQDPNYRAARRAFLVSYDRAVPSLRQADHCTACGQCLPHCPQGIDIPGQMMRIDMFVESLKQNTMNVVDLATLHSILRQGDHSLVVATAAGAISTYDSPGVVDLYKLNTESPEILKGALVADKIVGKGAAALMVEGRVKGVQTDVITREAIDYLRNHGVEVKYEQVIDSIINRTGTGMCPVESRCKSIENPDECLKTIGEFLRESNLI